MTGPIRNRGAASSLVAMFSIILLTLVSGAGFIIDSLFVWFCWCKGALEFLKLYHFSLKGRRTLGDILVPRFLFFKKGSEGHSGSLQRVETTYLGSIMAIVSTESKRHSVCDVRVFLLLHVSVA